MKILKIFLLMSFFFNFAAFSSERTLSERERHRLDNEVFLLKKIENPIAYLKERIRRLYLIHTKANAELKKFDDSLAANEKSYFLFESVSYRNLVVLKRLSDRESLETNYLVNEMMADPNLSEEELLKFVTFLETVLNMPTENLGVAPLEWPVMEKLYQDIDAELKLKKIVSYKYPSDSVVHRNGMMGKVRSYELFGREMIKAVSQQKQRDIFSKDQRFRHQLRLAKKDMEFLGSVKSISSRAKLYRTQGKLCYNPSAEFGGNITGREFPKGKWALTFDDGPRPGRSRKVFEKLREFRKEATFFWLAQDILSSPHYVREAYASGFEVGNHSYSHADVRRVGPKGRQRQITTATKRIRETMSSYDIKSPLRFYRLPYGAGARYKSIRNLIAKNNLVHVGWNVDSMDWQDKNTRSIFKRVWRQMRAEKGGVILFHDTHLRSAKALGLLLEHTMAKRDIQFFKLSDIVTVKKRCN